MKKLLVITIVIMSLCLSLVACSNNTTETPKDTSNTDNTENVENQETETPTCTNHIDVDGDNKCDNCSLSLLESEDELVDKNLVNGAEAFNKFLRWQYGIDYTMLNKTFVFGEVVSDNDELNSTELFPIEKVVFYENVAHIVLKNSTLINNMYIAMDTELMFTVTESNGNYNYDTLEYTNVFYDLLYLKMKDIDPTYLTYDESQNLYSVNVEYFDSLQDDNFMLADYSYKILFSINNENNIVELIVNEMDDATLSKTISFVRDGRDYVLTEWNYFGDNNSLQQMTYAENANNQATVEFVYRDTDNTVESFILPITITASEKFDDDVYERLNNSKFIYDNHEQLAIKYPNPIPLQSECQASSIAIFDEEFDCYLRFDYTTNGYYFSDIVDYNNETFCLGTIVDGSIVITTHAKYETKTEYAAQKYEGKVFTADGNDCYLIIAYDEEIHAYVIFYHITDSENQYEFEYVVPDTLSDLFVQSGSCCLAIINDTTLTVTNHAEHN